MRVLVPLFAVACVLGAVALFIAFGDQGLHGFTLWVRSLQASLQHDLAAGVRGWKDAPSFASLFSLASVCFLYGVFHAVGPGHGKAVLAAYAATTSVKVGRVFALAGLTAFVQATVAILVVGAALLVIGTGMRWATQKAEQWLEPVSYIAIAAIGLWILWGALRRLWALMPARAASVKPTADAAHHHHDHSHDHDHDHDHSHSSACEHHGHDDHHHHHHHHHHHDQGEACCGHAHAPPPGTDFRAGLALAFASGLRPCTGSLLVVGLCFGFGLWGLGIAASYAIGLGTALTVAILAGGVRMARGPFALIGQMARLSDRTWQRGTLALRLTGGILLVSLGAILLRAALTAPKPPI